jgi:hypothetical protein
MNKYIYIMANTLILAIDITKLQLKIEAKNYNKLNCNLLGMNCNIF